MIILVVCPIVPLAYFVMDRPTLQPIRRLVLQNPTLRRDLEQFFGSDLTTIRTAQALEEEIDKIKNTTTAIATELEGCCEEIKNLLKELSKDVSFESKGTRKLVNKRTTDILKRLSNYFSKLQGYFEEEFTYLKQILQKLEYFVDTDFDDFSQKLEEENLSDGTPNRLDQPSPPSVVGLVSKVKNLLLF